MNIFVRWVRFNLVGAMGMAVQLGALAVLNRCDDGHYLAASAAAVELAVLHNFAWHLRVTWPERRDGSAVLGQLVRFHLANGLVSIAGNLVLMRVLVGNAHLPVLVANGIAIVCCSVVNFGLSHTWAFAARGQEAECRP
ncbi:MAG TPA: GtrA family protein [Terracidiphilus sp.]|nr:GtrA family protein [Terracidiphilus sp.]